MQRYAIAALAVFVLAITFVAPAPGESRPAAEPEAGGVEQLALTTTASAAATYEYSVLAGIQPTPQTEARRTASRA